MLLRLVQEAKHGKYAETCLAHGLDLAPFSFSVLYLFGPVAEEILTRVCQRYISHAHIRLWEASMRGVVEKFIRY